MFPLTGATECPYCLAKINGSLEWHIRHHHA